MLRRRTKAIENAGSQGRREVLGRGVHGAAKRPWSKPLPKQPVRRSREMTSRPRRLPWRDTGRGCTGRNVPCRGLRGRTPVDGGPGGARRLHRAGSTGGTPWSAGMQRGWKTPLPRCPKGHALYYRKAARYYRETGRAVIQRTSCEPQQAATPAAFSERAGRPNVHQDKRNGRPLALFFFTR